MNTAPGAHTGAAGVAMGGRFGRGWVVVALLAGCGGGDGGGGGKGGGGARDPADDPPSPYVVEAPETAGPSASLGEIESALQAGFDTLLTLSPAPVHASYDAAMASRTGACPYEYATPDGTYWFDSCETDGGASFDGYVFAYGADGQLDPYSGLLADYWYAFGGAVVRDDAGRTLEVSGGATQYHAYGDYGGSAIDVYYADVNGTFRWDGPEARGTWMEDGVDPDFAWQSTVLLRQVGFYVTGGYSGFADGWSIAFDENQLGDELLGYPCAKEPTGTVSVRAPDGSWYDVRFDGTVEPGDAGDPACDGCGQAFFQGEKLGEVCVDTRPLLDAAVRPW